MSDARLSEKDFHLSAAPGRIQHLNLDDAWERQSLPFETIDLRAWGSRLRFSAPVREIERFARETTGQFAPFLVYGSGDFHHLSALWLRRFARVTTLVSFDNHPDWDIRPPRWGCGSWVNRALELPQIEKVSVWGCGSFECWWPGRIFGNNRAEREGRLEVHPWADERSAREQKRRGAILRSNWQDKFADFVANLNGADIYLTIDLDCLREEEAVTNWESGRFTIEDLIWAIHLLGRGSRIVAGDVCGAWSPPRYARRKQRFASEMDHPKLPGRDPRLVRQINISALHRLLPAVGALLHES
jgi:arginase family enzyme